MKHLGHALVEIGLDDMAKMNTTAFVSLNLSASQLNDADIARRIVDGAYSRGLDPSRLVIELTETALGHAGGILESLETFRSHGVRIWLDDFGTGLLVAFPTAALPGRWRQDRPDIRQPDRRHSPRQADRRRSCCNGYRNDRRRSGAGPNNSRRCATLAWDYAQGYLIGPTDRIGTEDRRQQRTTPEGGPCRL